MKVKSRNHVYETVPDFLGNRQIPAKDRDKEQIVIGLKVATLSEQDGYRREMFQHDQDWATDKAAEMKRDTTLKFIGSKVDFIRNLEIEGVELDEKGSIPFKTFYEEAPPEIVSWVSRAIMSTATLTEAERKNF